MVCRASTFRLNGCDGHELRFKTPRYRLNRLFFAALLGGGAPPMRGESPLVRGAPPSHGRKSFTNYGWVESKPAD